MNNQTLTAQYEMDFSYNPLPFFSDMDDTLKFNKKLDLNLYCIKRPKQTCFIHVTNPNMLAWGIESGDMLVVEKNDDLYSGDLVVLEENNEFHVYEFIAHSGNYLFMALDSTTPNINTKDWSNLPIVGTVTNTIHQMKRRDKMKWAA